MSINGIYELSASDTERVRIERISNVLRERRSMICHVERLLGITVEMGS